VHAIVSYDGLPIEDSLSLLDVPLPMPVPMARDVLVRVEAVSVNPVDVRRRARLTPNGTPTVLGVDAAGIVERVGSEVSSLNVGDPVFYAGDVTRQGANAEYQVVDERLVARRPASLSAAEAAALPLTAVTAAESLFERFGLTAESTGTLLVVGGAGGVGSIMIQLAKELTGVRVVATASRERSREWASRLGADVVLDHDDLKSLSAMAPDGVDFVFDPHTAGTVETYVAITRRAGHIIALDEPGAGAGEPEPLGSKGIAWHRGLDSLHAPDLDRRRHELERLARLVDDGRIRSTLTEAIDDFSADGLRHAHTLVESGRMTGKVVVHR
jgi:NADPH2:quinone reductase